MAISGKFVIHSIKKTCLFTRIVAIMSTTINSVDFRVDHLVHIYYPRSVDFRVDRVDYFHTGFHTGYTGRPIQVPTCREMVPTCHKIGAYVY